MLRAQCLGVALAASATRRGQHEATNGIAGGTPREDPSDGTPCKKVRSGEAAVYHTKTVAAIKDGHEAETLEEEADDAGVDDNEVASGGRRHPTTATTLADAANLDNNEATNGGRQCPTTVTDAASVDDDEVASGGRRRPTTATTVVDAANVDGDEATNGIAGGTPREDPADRTPRKKARSGEGAVDRTKAFAGQHSLQQGHQG